MRIRLVIIMSLVHDRRGKALSVWPEPKLIEKKKENKKKPMPRCCPLFTLYIHGYICAYALIFHMRMLTWLNHVPHQKSTRKIIKSVRERTQNCSRTREAFLSVKRWSRRPQRRRGPRAHKLSSVAQSGALRSWLAGSSCSQFASSELCLSPWLNSSYIHDGYQP